MSGARIVLIPFSWLYGAVATVRNLLFEIGILPRDAAGVPVISVGNMTAGGTGKTPLVERIVEWLLEHGHAVAVVSRGYGRTTEGVVVVSDGKRVLVNAAQGGDEPVQLARRFPGLRVVVGERRVDAAREAVSSLGATVIVLDDGFQHRYLKRDLDIVVVDSREDLWKEPMLPAGFRREPMRGLRRADVVAFSKVAYGDTSWADGAGRWYRGPVAAFRHATHAVISARDQAELSAEQYRGKPIVAFSGIGDHESFVAGLEREGFVVAGAMRFRDHHRFTTDDAERLLAYAREKHAEALVTTEKDIVRIHADGPVGDVLRAMPLWYTRVTVELLSGGSEMFARIAELVQRENA
jgi:tetraacyldisaccharide 4'-kinase